MLSPSARNIRQAEIIPQEDLARVAAVVVGCGAIGSWLVRMLAQMGVTQFVLVDPDVVSVENLVLQGFAESDLGSSKVSALQVMVSDVNSDAAIDTIKDRFKPKHLNRVLPSHPDVAVFCCVDSIDVRREIYEACSEARPALFVDGRMAALAYRVITVDSWPDLRYGDTLFAAEEAYQARCTAKGTVCTAAAPAVQMATQLLLWLKGCRVRDGGLAPDVEGNLLMTTFGMTDAEQPA